MRPNTTYKVGYQPIGTAGRILLRTSDTDIGWPGWSIGNSVDGSDHSLYLYVDGAPVLGAPTELAGYWGSLDDDPGEVDDVSLSWSPPQHHATGAVRHYVVETCTASCDEGANWQELATVSTPSYSQGSRINYFYTHRRGAEQPTRSYRVSAFNGFKWPAAEWTLPPRPLAASIVSTPESAITYRYGETVDVAVDFNFPVNVVGAPSLALAIGDDSDSLVEALARYHDGSGTTRLVFRYTVGRDIVDSTGLQLHENPLRIVSPPEDIREVAPANRSAEGNLEDWLNLKPRHFIDSRNNDPEFGVDDPAYAIVPISETVGDSTEAAARDIGLPLTATDADGDTLSYSLEGDGAAFFEIDESTAQLRTIAGERYDREQTWRHHFRVKADDGRGGTDSMAVRVTIKDVDEPPLAPDAPAVSRAFHSTPSLETSWTAPGNAGRPDIEHYDVQYREGTGGAWLDGPQDVTGTSATITGLRTDTDYQVQVRAVNDEGDGAWSDPGPGRTWPAQQPATGAPAISGIWQVGRTLTASKGDVADVNGVPPESEFRWQWWRVDGANEIRIPGATAKTYALGADDAGKRVRVTALFTDGLGNLESRTSLPYPVHGSVMPTTCTVTPLGGRREVWSATVTAGAIADDMPNGRFEHGYSNGGRGRLSDRDFAIGPTRYAVELLSTQLVAGEPARADLRLELDRGLTAVQRAALRLDVCDDEIALSGSRPESSLDSFRFEGFGSLWFDGLARRVRLSLPANSPATGAPDVSRTQPVVGLTLTASPGDIADPDTMPDESEIDWQWLRVEGETETEIAGATGKTYMPTGGDFGRNIRVRASFTDGLGAPEARLSAATAPVTSETAVVTISADASAVREGTAAIFTVDRGAGTTAALTVRIDVAESGEDLVAPDQEGRRTVSFAEGQASATLRVETVDDAKDTSDSRVTAAILNDSAEPVAYWLGDPASASVAVRDDDNRLNIRKLGGPRVSDICQGLDTRPNPPIEGNICLGVWFNGTDPAGFTDSDLDVENGRVVSFRHESSNSTVWRMIVGVTGDQGDELVFRIPEDSLDVGNEEAVYRRTITGTAARLTMTTPATPPVTGQFRIDMEFSHSVAGERQDITNVTGLIPRPSNTHQVFRFTNGSFVRYEGFNRSGDKSFDMFVQPRGGFEGELSVVLPDQEIESQDSRGVWVQEARFDIAVDTKAPTLESAVLGADSQVVELTFHEELDGESIPAVSAFRVMANGETVDIADPVVVGQDTVRLTLPEAIEPGTALSVSYAVPRSGSRIRDGAGNAAPGFSRRVDTGAPEVVIAPDMSEVTEGENVAAAFTLRRTGDTSKALTVSVTVSETGDMISAADEGPRPVTFEAAAAAATLDVPVENDEVVEDDSTVTVELVADTSDDSAYGLGVSSSASVTVRDDENRPPTAVMGTVETPEDTPYAFRAADFGFADDDAGDALASVTVVTLPDAGSLALDGTPLTEGQAVPAAELATLVFTPAADAHGTDYASFAFKVSDGTDDSAEAYTMTVHVTAENDAPAFAAAALERRLAENPEAGASVGPPVPPAADADGDSLSYTLEGPDAAAFAFAAATRQITAKEGVVYDFEARDAYAVTVKADDGKGGTATVAVSIALTDVDEPPLAPDRPGVTPTAGTTTSLDVGWTPPANDGRPAILHYDVQYRDGAGGAWLDGPQDVSATRTTLTGLAADTAYQVQVRAVNDEGDGAFSEPGGGSTANTPPTAEAGTVETPEDTPYAFRAADFGFADDDAGDALESVTIVTPPDAGSFTLDGTPVTAGQVVARTQIDAGKLIFAPAADAHGRPYASFAFKVSDGTADSAAAYTMTLDVDAVNDPAAGTPTISGIARVGQTLSAAAGSVADVDGMPGEDSFAWQWIRIDGADESPIADATATTYTLGADDEGRTLKVALGFTDDDGNAESRTSAPTASVAANAAPTGAANEVTTEEDTAHGFSAAAFGFEDDDAGDALAGVRIVTPPASTEGTLELDGSVVSANQWVAAADLDTLVYTPPANAHGEPYTSFAFKVSDGTDDSAEAYTMTVHVTAMNDAATGLPTISGTARVGETLSASVSGIADPADGLTRAADGEAGYAFAYQWYRVTGHGEAASAAPIADATASTYLLVAADQSRRFRVAVSFKDDDGHDETLTSEPYPSAQESVLPNTPPTAVTGTVETPEDTPYAFRAADFGFADDDAGDALASVTVVTLPDAGSLALDGTPLTEGQAVPAAELATLVFTPAADAHGTDYASFAFKVSDGTDDSAEAYTMTVHVTAENDAPAFAAAALERRLAENPEAGASVGPPVPPAADADGDSLSYTLEGPDAAAFAFAAATRQITAKEGVVYDFEARDAYAVTVKADDGKGGTATVAVSIALTDVDEPPLAPDRPGVTPTAGTTTSLDVGWTPPANDGRPAILHYDVQYRDGAGGAWLDGPQDVSATRTTLTGLAADTAYQVQVRAVNDEGDGAFSEPGGGSTANTPPTAEAGTVETPEDTPYAFRAADFGFADDDAGDALESVTIVTPPDAGSFTLDGTPVTAGQVVARTQIDAGKLIFAPAADAHGRPYASFAFKVSDGTADSAAAYTMTLDVDAVNDPAAGTPTISGIARVGQTLSAAAGSVADVDGMPGEDSFAWQWIRIDGADESPIADATATTYTLGADDEGRTLKVALGFTDDDGNAESRTSAPTASVAANAAPTGAANEVTTEEDTAHGFSAAAFGFEDDDAGDALAGVRIVTPPASTEGTLELDGSVVSANQWVAAADLDTLVYTPPANAHGEPYTSFAFKVSDGTDDSAEAYTMTVHVTAMNDAATGLPTISGTARVGETLSASVSGIADPADGLTRAADGEAGYAFAYQWYRVTGHGEAASAAPIADATASTYLLVAADQSRRFRVAVSFKDDDGHDETLTSEPYPSAQESVLPNTPPTAVTGTVETPEDTPYAFRAADFGFADDDAGDALASVTVVTLPDAGSLALDGTPLTEGQAVPAAELATLVFTPAADAHGTDYASFAFKVSDGTDDSAEAYTMTVHVTAENDAPAFAAAALERRLAENPEAGASVGPPVPPAADADGDSLSYTLEGPDAAAFAFAAATRQITAKEGVVYDFEARDAYAVTVKADDGKGGTATVAVSIALTDVDEPPLAPDRPGVTPTAGTTTSLDVGWTPPANDGRPAILHYDVQYRDGAGGAWLDGPQDVSATRTTLTGLAADTAYQVQVRAVNDEGDGAFSEPGGGSTANTPPTAEAGTVETPEDTPYAFRAADFGFADDDAGDALESVTIVTPPDAGSFTLDGTPVTAGQVVARTQIDAGKLIFAPAADAHGRPYASFAFKVSDGTADSAAAYTMTLDVDAVNDPAAGTPTISGIARVGQTLSAAAGSVADVDGMPGEDSFAWQWIRIDGADESPIADATATTYTLGADDEGRTLKVALGFTDDDGNAESRTSEATVAVQESMTSNVAPTAVTGTVTVPEDTPYPFKEEDFGFADDDAGDALASVRIVTLPGAGALKLAGTAATEGQVVPAAELATLVFTPEANAHGQPYASFTFRVSDGTDESAEVYTMAVIVTAANDPATGAPTISGDARVGQTLSADAGSVADVDGMPAEDSFAWQWIRVDGADESPIADATATTYTPGADDEGRTLKVALRFTDLDGHEEELTSAATASVAANGPPAGTDGMLRLVDGQTPNEGRLEIFHEGEWGTICDDRWERVESSLSCRLLGYTDTVEDWERYRTGYFPPGTGSIILDDLRCKGDESNLLECPRAGNLDVREHNCRHTEDVGLRCSMEPLPRLVNIEMTSSPGADARYGTGDTIELTLVWNVPVVIETPAGLDSPKLWLHYYRGSVPSHNQGTILSPGYVRGSGTKRTVFAATLGSEQLSHSLSWASLDKLLVEANTLKLRDGDIRSVASGHAAMLQHGEYRWELLQTQPARAAPVVTSLPTVTAPGAGEVYSEGDRIEASVAFDAPVIVNVSEGSPTLGLALGGVRHAAAYVGGSGTSVLTFALVVPGAADGAGVAKAIANGMELNGATIRGANGTNAVLGFGEAPGVASVSIASDRNDNGAWDAGEPVEVSLLFEEPVEVEIVGGRPSVVVVLGGGTQKQAEYASGTGTNTLVFLYTLAQSDGPASSVLVTPNSLALNGGAIRSTAGLPVKLEHAGVVRARVALRAPRTPLSAVSVADANADEGETLAFPVTLSPAATQTVTVDWATVDGTATAPADYAAASGTLEFSPGETEKTVHVVTAADDADEAPETLTLVLSKASGATIGDGEATGTVSDAGAASFTASFSGVAAEHDGVTPFELGFAFSEAPAEPFSYKTVRNLLFEVSGGHIEWARRETRGENVSWDLTVRPGGIESVTLTMHTSDSCTGEGKVCSNDGIPLTGTVTTTIPGPAQLSVADAEAREGAGETLDFVVTLSRARTEATTVDYATADVTATTGEDYRTTSGTLSFEAGVTERTVSVPVLDDTHDEAESTMTLTLSNPVPAAYVRIADATATGTIRNDDPMPQAWIARFGRTVAEQVIEAVESRLRDPRRAGTELSLAGERFGGAPPSAGDQAALEERAAAAHLDALSDGFLNEDGGGFRTRAVTERELLTGSAFTVTGGSAETGFGALWGRAAVSRFEGREGELALDGEVVSAMVGADWTRDAAAAGVLVSHSRGEGSYRSSSGGGDVDSTLTGLYPYGSLPLGDRVLVWGTVGYGSGELTMTPEGQGAMVADMDLAMAGAGVRGEILAPEPGAGASLAVTSDGFAARTASDGIPGKLASAEATVTRFRVGVEGSWALALGDGGVLTPSLEVGVRHDGGDAETGLGTDMGAGLAWSDPWNGVEAEVRARGLLSHAAEGLSERGFAGSLSWDPDPSSDRGAALTILQTVGGPASGGMSALFARGTMERLAANDDGSDPERRTLEARLGYGFGLFADRYTGTPEIGIGLTESHREVMLGWRLAEDPGTGLALGLGLEAARREPLGDDAGVEQRLAVSLGWRLGHLRREDVELEFGLDAQYRAAANDDWQPDGEVRLHLTVRW